MDMGKRSISSHRGRHRHRLHVVAKPGRSSISVTELNDGPADRQPNACTAANSPVTQAAPPAVACGPDQAAALSAALAQYPADPATGWLWHHIPLYSNYDPCADLSTIVVTVEGATGSSPVQALMFHRGTFLGTGTSESYAFTNLDSSASTKDTVVLTYRSGQSCTACGDGIVTTVRYHWDGSKVQMLDPPPPG